MRQNVYRKREIKKERTHFYKLKINSWNFGNIIVFTPFDVWHFPSVFISLYTIFNIDNWRITLCQVHVYTFSMAHSNLLEISRRLIKDHWNKTVEHMYVVAEKSNRARRIALVQISTTTDDHNKCSIVARPIEFRPCLKISFKLFWGAVCHLL